MACSERTPRRWIALLAFVLLAIAASATAAAAQSATGSIEGVVVDASGAVLPGVLVTVTAAATGAARSVTTDERGIFRVPLLPVGRYELAAELSGFATRKSPDLVLTIGQTLDLRIEMAVATVSETVEVSGQTPIIETTRSQVSATVSEQAVANLPVNGRNFIDFVLLTPGVTRDVRTGDISFAGQRGTLNSLVVDGADNNNTFFGQTLGRTGSGRAPYQFSQDAVKEFQVNSNAYAAEYGRAGGAVINVVTKSGTNTFSGAVFEFYRDKALNANDALNVLRRLPKSPYHYNQFGGNLGGPMVRNRHFFFFDYDGQRNTQPNLVFVGLPSSVPTDADSQAALARLRTLAESWERTQNQDVFLIKTDHELGGDARLTLRYNHQNFTGGNFENGGPQLAVGHTGASKVFTRTFNVTVTHIIGTRMFNEARLQYARDREPGEANTNDPEANIREAGTLVLSIGRNTFSPRETTIRRWQAADTLTMVNGAHKMKFGVDTQFDQIYNFFPGNFGGSYTFNTLASFNTGRPASYLQAFSGPGTSGPETYPDIKEYSLFVQDEWRARNDLTLNLGVRYDRQNPAKPETANPDPQLAAAGIDTRYLETDGNNWGPRLGLAWGPSGKPFVIRAGYGVFFGRTPSIMVGTAHSNNGINVVNLDFTGAAAPTYPAVFTSLPAGGAARRPSIVVFDRGFENPRVQQASAGIEHRLTANTTLGVNYLFVRGDSLPRSIDTNFGAMTQVTYTVAGTGQTLQYHQFAAGPLTNFARVIEFQSTAESRYNGLTLELNRRFAASFQGRVAYTIGRVVDTVPDATAVVPGSTGDDLKYASNPADFEADRTDGSNDQRHRLVMSGILQTTGLAEKLTGIARALAANWTFAAIYAWQTGQPYTARVGAVDLNRDGNPRNDIAPGTQRNEFRFPRQASLDPRIARDIPLGRAKLQLILEGFNVLNYRNVNNVNMTLYNVSGTTLTRQATFGAPLGFAPPRILQLAVKVIY